MPEPKTEKSQKPAVSNDNENVGQRGEATQAGGNKIHGDDLEGMIPHTPMNDRGGEKRRK